MIGTLTLIACLAGAAQASLAWDKESLLVKFAYTLTGVGTDAFVAMPLNTITATSKGWVQVDRPTGPSGLSSLVLYCPSDDYTVCCLYDDNDYISGLQIAMDQEYLSDAAFDWETQGFTEWSVTLTNGTIKTYWSIQQYYVSATTLATSAASRLASRNTTTILQDEGIWVTGPNKDLYNISTNTDYITGSGSPYTEQACIPWMGNHYYYNMSSTLECTAGNVFSWFPLVYSKRLVGVGFMVFTKYNAGSSWFESPTKSAVQLIVPRAPECLYTLAEAPCARTLHVYFVDPAYTMTCVFE